MWSFDSPGVYDARTVQPASEISSKIFLATASRWRALPPNRLTYAADTTLSVNTWMLRPAIALRVCCSASSTVESSRMLLDIAAPCCQKPAMSGMVSSNGAVAPQPEPDASV